MAAVQPAGSWDGNTAGERRWTFLGRNGREGDTEDWLEVFDRVQSRTQTLNPENPLQTRSKTILESAS